MTTATNELVSVFMADTDAMSCFGGEHHDLWADPIDTNPASGTTYCVRCERRRESAGACSVWTKADPTTIARIREYFGL